MSSKQREYVEWAIKNPDVDAIVRMSSSAYELNVSEAVDYWVHVVLKKSGLPLEEYERGVSIWEACSKEVSKV